MESNPTIFVFILASLIAMTSPNAFAEPIYGQTRTPSWEREALVRVVSVWDSNCDATNVRSLDNMVDNWYDTITDADTYGDDAWSGDGFYHNGNIVDSDFTDPDVVAWGRDFENDHVDEPDAVLVGLHGGVGTGGRWNAIVRVNEPGDGNCTSWQGHMRFGNSDLEFLHMVSCHSMNQDVWELEWQDSFSRLHQAEGFHGVTRSSRFYAHRYESFAQDGFENSIAQSWIDHLYKDKTRANRDMCPVARVHGVGPTEAEARIADERYDWVFPDPIPGAGTAVVIYISGCDPLDQPPLSGPNGQDHYSY
jgi:hypothetical protein